MDLLLSGGPVLAAIVLLSLYGVYLFFARYGKLRTERGNTDDLMRKVNQAVRARNLDEALAVTKTASSPVARVLHSALSRLPYGRTAVDAAFSEASLLEEARLSKGLRPLATIAQVAPLLGLLGTVTGMIISFAEIASASAGNPALMALGIRQALVTTAAGLVVAIPMIMGHSYLSSIVDSLLLDVDRRREELMVTVAEAAAATREER